MRRKNNQTNCFKSTSSLSLSFKSGNLLSHPSGFEKFREQSKLIQEQKQHRNDILMLNKSPNFVNRQRDSDEIDSDIENAPSDFKRFEEKKIYVFKNGKRTETIIPVFRQGQEFSQFDDEEEDIEIEYDRFKKNGLNPEEQMEKEEKKQYIMNVLSGNKEEIKVQNESDFPLQKSQSSQFERKSQNSGQFDEVDPDFLAYLLSE